MGDLSLARFMILVSARYIYHEGRRGGAQTRHRRQLHWNLLDFHSRPRHGI
jgi:hypothetical protein